MTRESLLVMLAGATLIGCATGAQRTEPKPKVAENWSTPRADVAKEVPVAPEAWWTVLEDDVLNGLIARAASANHDVRLASARVREARGSRRAAGAALMPSVRMNGSWTTSRTPEFQQPGSGSPIAGGVSVGPNGVSRSISIAGDRGSVSRNVTNGEATTSVNFADPVGEFDRTSNLFQAGFDATWELDFFGAERNAAKAAQANLEAVESTRRAVLVSVLAETALNYLDLRAAQRLREIAEKNIAAQDNSSRIARERFRVGLNSEFDATRAETQLATLRAQIPGLDHRAKQAMHRLATLVGDSPDALKELLSAASPLPAPPDVVSIGLPSDLLRRRADVRAAELQLAAADARIKVAVADLFPKFGITSNLSSQATNLAGLFSATNALWSLAPGVTWDILRWNYIRSNIEIQNARQEQAAIGYEQSVLNAIEDTETSLSAYVQERARRADLVLAVEGSQKSVAIANERYVRGLENYLGVLQSQQTLYATETDLLQSEVKVLTDLIALYKALGGGWESFEPGLAAN